MRNNKKGLVIGLLCAVMVFMGIGYAIFSSTLTITGTSRAGGTFDVHIDDVTTLTASNKKTAGANDVTGYPTYNDTTATLQATFMEPGDFITYQIDVVNTGSIDAVITASVVTDEDSSFEMICDNIDGTELVATVGTTSFECMMKFKEGSTTVENVTTGTMSVQVTAIQKAYYTPSQPGQVCYTPLNETKTLGVISGNTKTPVATYGVNNIQAGDLVGFGTSEIDSNEQFYVLENNNGVLKLLSRYLINVAYTDGNNNSHQRSWDNCSRDTRGLQDSRIGLTRANVNVAVDFEDSSTYVAEALDFENEFAYGTVPFSSTNYWWDSTNSTYASGYSRHSSVYSGSLVQGYVNSYVSTLTTMGLNVTNGTVLSIQELGTICSTDFTGSNSSTSSCPNYIFETTYWLGSIRSNDDVWYVSSDSNVNFDIFDYGSDVGVRPVISVTLS